MRNFVTFIFIGAILVLGFLVANGTPQTNNPKSDSSPDSTSSTSPAESSSTPVDAAKETPAQGGSAPTGRVFAATTGQTSEIYTLDVTNKQKKVIYTDKSDKAKLRLISNVTRDGDTIVALVSENEGEAGQLVAIKTDGSGSKTTIIDNFIASTAPVISPDKTKLAMISFSNAEPNYGFTLIHMDVNGKNRKDISKNESGISHIAFSPDGKEIAYLKGAAASSNEVVAVDISSGKERNIYRDSNRVIENFSWSPVGLLTITAAPPGKKASDQSEVFLVDPKNKSAIQITKNNLPERTPAIAPDASGISFIQSKTAKIEDSLKVGDVIVTYSDGSKATTIGSANQLLGWVR